VQNPHFIGLGENEFIKEALDIVSKAKEKGIVLRVIGSLAIRLYAGEDQVAISIHKKRFDDPEHVFTDLDLVGYGKQRGSIEKFFAELQYQPDRMINRLFGDRRMIYYHPKGYFSIDIFINKLEFSHDVRFGEKPGEGRLELSYPAITPTDIVLEKLQIHQINKKDIVDLIVLFSLKEVGNDEKSINGSYIAKILAQDWGFWYDATNNLQSVKQISKDMLEKQNATEAIVKTVIERVDNLLQVIEKEPKTKDWIKRSQVGVKKPWYREVSDIF
jgi:hypothetical protein